MYPNISVSTDEYVLIDFATSVEYEQQHMC